MAMSFARSKSLEREGTRLQFGTKIEERDKSGVDEKIRGNETELCQNWKQNEDQSGFLSL